MGEEVPTPTLVDASGTVLEGAGRADVEQRMGAGSFFWLDLPGLGEEELSWLRQVFGFHPLAVEDAVNFAQRPKVEEYQGYIVLVLYGSRSAASGWRAPDGSSPVCSPEDLETVSEVHCFLSESYLVTVHRDNCPAFAGLARRIRGHGQVGESPGHLFHLVADTLVDSFFPVLSELDDRIDALQDQVIARPTNEQLGELLEHKRSLISLRRVIAPQRDLFAVLASGVTPVPGHDVEVQRYLRDIYDHLIRLSDLVDSYRDLLSGTTDAYLSVVSNQLNMVMKQLTIIATVFLPLTFLTGFFGQNFAWLTSHIGGFAAFAALGLGGEAVAVAALVLMFRRRGWLGG